MMIFFIKLALPFILDVALGVSVPPLKRAPRAHQHVADAVLR